MTIAEAKRLLAFLEKFFRERRINVRFEAGPNSVEVRYDKPRKKKRSAR